MISALHVGFTIATLANFNQTNGIPLHVGAEVISYVRSMTFRIPKEKAAGRDTALNLWRPIWSMGLLIV